ncbi:MAG TPA: hypothetical protein PK079_22645 [Leptospiraceae bacterium]|nr:hypothetical protein [Leptospiraceae bacterium]HNC59899.1 hypothetical protein [Leptospiraceae bacterium]HNE55982.1 hypothetical protein [Leptospiraceae bacterium]HNF57498.1 hypothetical protein [Leptospiraceae bacterium]
MISKVKINRYHPVLVDLKLFLFGTSYDFTIVDTTKSFFTVSDNVGLKLDTHSQAEAYCENQEYDWGQLFQGSHFL